MQWLYLPAWQPSTNACMALLRAEDEFVVRNSLFTSSELLFTNVFKKYGNAICGLVIGAVSIIGGNIFITDSLPPVM